MQLTVKHIDDDFETASGTKEYVFHSKYVPGVGDTILLPSEIYRYPCEVENVIWDFTGGSREANLNVTLEVSS